MNEELTEAELNALHQKLLATGAGTVHPPEEFVLRGGGSRVGQVEHAVDQFVKGLPVLGGLAERIDPVSPELRKQAAADYPLTGTVAKGAGTVAGYAALPASSMATLPAAMGTNAAISGADTALRGGSPSQVGLSALGGAGGAAAGYGIGRGLERTFDVAADKAVKSMIIKGSEHALPTAFQSLSGAGAVMMALNGHLGKAAAATALAMMANPVVRSHVLTYTANLAAALNRGGVPAIVGGNVGAAVGRSLGRTSNPQELTEEQMKALQETLNAPR